MLIYILGGTTVCCVDAKSSKPFRWGAQRMRGAKIVIGPCEKFRPAAKNCKSWIMRLIALLETKKVLRYKIISFLFSGKIILENLSIFEGDLLIVIPCWGIIHLTFFLLLMPTSSSSPVYQARSLASPPKSAIKSNEREQTSSRSFGLSLFRIDMDQQTSNVGYVMREFASFRGESDNSTRSQTGS